MQNETRSNRDGKYNCEEKNSRNSNGDKSISEGQEEFDNTRNNRETANTENSDRTLLQNGQKQSNSESRDMEEIKGDTQSGQSLRQTSDGILREGSGIRDDKKSLQFREDKPNISNIRYFSMFSGVGGFELGLESANNSINARRRETKRELSPKREDTIRQRSSQSTINESESDAIYRCVGFSEIDKYSIQTYQKNFPNHINFGDCTKIDPTKLPDFDMLCGGFPCQAFSIAGKRRGFDDTRGTMFFEVARILKVKRPKIVFLENVKGLLNHEKGKTFKIIIQTLDELGYEVQWMVLNSKFFGVPQNRERVFIIGSLRESSRPEILPFRTIMSETSFEGKQQQGILISAKTGARPVEQSNCLDTMYHKGLGSKQERPGVAIMDLYNNKEHSDRSPALTEPHHNNLRVAERFPLKFINRNQKNIEGDYSFTIDGANTGGIKQGMKIRRLTPIECERLQGFPDGHTDGVSDTQRYKQMGNAVTVNVIAAIGTHLHRKIK